jgi:hypothetical protein
MATFTRCRDSMNQLDPVKPESTNRHRFTSPLVVAAKLTSTTSALAWLGKKAIGINSSANVID